MITKHRLFCQYIVLASSKINTDRISDLTCRLINKHAWSRISGHVTSLTISHKSVCDDRLDHYCGIGDWPMMRLLQLVGRYFFHCSAGLHGILYTGQIQAMATLAQLDNANNRAKFFFQSVKLISYRWLRQRRRRQGNVVASGMVVCCQTVSHRLRADETRLNETVVKTNVPTGQNRRRLLTGDQL